jgi:hypothetical protein
MALGISLKLIRADILDISCVNNPIGDYSSGD